MVLGFRTGQRDAGHEVTPGLRSDPVVLPFVWSHGEGRFLAGAQQGPDLLSFLLPSLASQTSCSKEDPGVASDHIGLQWAAWSELSLSHEVQLTPVNPQASHA